MGTTRSIGSALFAFALFIIALPVLAENRAEYEGEITPPNTAIQKIAPKNGGLAVGTYVGWTPTSTTGGYPVGLEHDGAGNLYLTDIADFSLYRITTGGSTINSWGGLLGNPIGVTSDGNFIYVTDAIADSVQIYMMDGTHVGGFPVSVYTTFPEGITYCPNNGHLYVVGGSGWNIVIEYTRDGTAVTLYPINGSSPDGIAWDPMRQCFWLYDSGTDTVRQYDTSFVQMDSFPGTINAGFSSGEGLAVIGDSLYVVATGSDAIVEFDITYAIGSFDICIQSQDGTQKFNFNSATGMFQYCDETLTIEGTATVTATGTILILRGISNDGHMVFASADLGPAKIGGVVIRISRDELPLTMSRFIKDGIVHMNACPCF